MDETSWGPESSPVRSLYRGGPGRLLGGVCLALARRMGLEVAVLRVCFVLALLMTGGSVLLAYLALWVLVPATPQGRAPAERVAGWVRSVASPAQETSRWERRV